MPNSRCRLIAFYLPQYHPIPENDQWWGKGFTEWTNVTKARPLFRGHQQPNLPADLGFYDLRVPEVRAQQAALAQAYGIEGFCYWHYWFAGRQLLQRPFQEVVTSSQPQFPFCLGWVNAHWRTTWYGATEKILLQQEYPGVEDERQHFQALLPALRDERYLRVDGKPLLIIHNPGQLPNGSAFVAHWQELAQNAGLGGLYLVAVNHDDNRNTLAPYDGWLPLNPRYALRHYQTRVKRRQSAVQKWQQRLLRKFQFRTKPPQVGVYPYAEVMRFGLVTPTKTSEHSPCYFPCAVCNWDNTPRAHHTGFVLQDATPLRWQEHLQQAIAQVEDRPFDQRIVFIKSWNEWAEGNYLEPDQRWGHAYLQVIKDCVEQGEN